MKQVQDYNQKIRSIKKMPEFRAGDVIRVHRKIKEGNKERIQIFEGIIISIKGGQSSSPTATVRRVAHGTGVELTIPLLSPTIQKIEAVKRAKTRKSKLYYLREKGFKLSKLKMKELGQFIVEEEEKPSVKEESAVESMDAQKGSENKKAD